ncbi:TonB-dependent receptor plug domain-containing protein [Sphingomonas aerophila]|uniref:Vitamin B12 transporter n=1 Tax=Sphingomonas aerophila TaxID=1344948 RepID=A0A7W9BCB9_9SPHN|nr:TonB-dependent receptor [Sphingomonas aerophila]MBB5714389.1 vitamin B12 transporter [Sphingomonas aerophila]
MSKFSFLAGLALIAPAALHAQQIEAPRPDAAATPDATEAGDSVASSPDTVVVVANRAPTSIDRVTASVTVLDKAAIDRAGDFAIADLLVRTPGVSLSRNGGYGTVTSLRIRGAEADQTAVVIDGVKLNDPSSPGGGFDFGNLLTNDATRVEVLRGPQSILWGSQAIGGVVNIVTPLPGETLEGSADVEAGSRDTVSGRAAIGGRTGPLSFRIGAQAFTTDGISAIAPGFGGGERDGYTNQSVAGRALLELAPGLSADVRGYYSNGRIELDGFAGDSFEYSKAREFVGYAGLNLDLFDGRFRNRVGYGYTNVDRDNFDPQSQPDKTFESNGRNERFEYQGSVAITNGIDATFGAENEVSRFRSASPAFGTATDRGRAEVTSFYGQLNATVAQGLTLTGGVRNDDHNRFGSQTLFAAGGVYTAPWGTVIRASYSEGFKAPTLYQLFSEYGNQSLDPERAKGWEAGAEQRFLDGRVAVGATYFERRSRDLISFASCFAPTTDPLCLVPGSTTAQRFGYYSNIARAFAHGVEAAGRVAITSRLLVDGNYSWIASEDRSAGSASFGNQLARRPRHSWNAGASYSLPAGASIGANVRWSGETFENVSNTIRLKPYTLVDARVELPVLTNVRLFVRGENLFDRKYQTAYGFGTLGRSIYAGFRGRF